MIVFGISKVKTALYYNTDFLVTKAWVSKGIRDSCSLSYQQRSLLLNSCLISNEN